MDTVERFFAKVHINITTGHWEWLGGKAGAGYGLFFLHKTPVRRNIYAHRFAYKFFFGPITKGKEIDHICEIKFCVNPFHLREVTHRENMLLGDTIASRNLSKTHCPQGHIYAGKNVRIVKNGSRICKVCHR